MSCDTLALASLVASTEYHLFDQTRTMVCALKLKNGFVVVGQSSCIDPTKFSLKLGMEYACDDAMRKLGEHAAYAQAVANAKLK